MNVYGDFKLIILSLVLPPGGPIVIAVLGLLSMRGHPRAGRVLVVGGVAALWLCSLPIVANALVTAVGGARPVDLAAARTADAIVILGGGVRSQAIEYGGDTLGRLTLERVRYGAYLARLTKLPMLVTGGAPGPRVRAEGDLMRDALEQEFGLSVRWVDRQARDTRQNAVNAASLLAGEGKRKVLLVVHGFDVRRAKGLFEAAGLAVIAAPTQVPCWGELAVADFLPDVSALYGSHFALYEALALVRDQLAH